MRKYLFAFLAALFFAVISFQVIAGWNIRQNEDGTTDWVKTDPVTAADQEVWEVGRVTLHGYMPDIATARTIGISIPITSARIARVQVSINGTFAGSTNVFGIWRAQGVTAALFAIDDSTTGAAAALTAEVTDGNARLQVGVTGDGNTGSANDAFVPTGNYFVGRDHVILISSDGGATNAANEHVDRKASANFTITLVPR